MGSRNSIECLVALFCFLNVFPYIKAQGDSKIVIVEAHRDIDLSTQLVKVQAMMRIENRGSSPVNGFTYILEATESSQLSFINVLDDGEPLVLSRKGSNGQHSSFEIKFRSPLPKGVSKTVVLESVFTNMLEPHPAKITQSEKQLVRYFGSAYLLSSYEVLSQTTSITLSNNNLESYTKVKPHSQSENKITYGPYVNIKPLTKSDIVVHYENNSPFLTVTRLERLIEVSHWGNIAVEEKIDVLHTGASLKGPFSRYEFQRENSGVSSVRHFKTVLPASARDVYYRDDIGNISTSHMKVLEDAVELDLRPRFPLFGGWKTQYTMGYNVPSYEYLFSKGNSFCLKMRFMDHVFDDMIVDELVVKIILPEKSSDLKLKAPYDVEQLPIDLHYTYLDTTGRPTITAAKRNLMENHIQDFELYYTFPKMYMVQEPLIAIIAFYLLFLLVIVYVRLDFSISKDEQCESKLRIGGYCDKISSHHSRRVQSYKQHEDALHKFKTSKDSNALTNTLKTIHADLKAETQHINDMLVKLKSEAPELAEKVTELQRQDRSVKEIYTQQVTQAEKLVAGKMTKQQYVDSEASLVKKKDDAIDKMEMILASF